MRTPTFRLAWAVSCWVLDQTGLNPKRDWSLRRVIAALCCGQIRMKKIGLLLFGAVIVLAIAALVAGKIAGGYLTPEFLVRQMESSLGCRAEIESVKVSFLGSANVKIKGLSLGQRDKYVEDGTALANRLPMEKKDILVKSASLSVSPIDLMKRRLYVKHLVLDGVDVRIAMRKDGTTTIDELFSELGKKDPAAGTGKGEVDKASEEGSIPMAIKADRLEMTNSQFTVDIEASGSRVELQNAGFGFFEIDIDPEQLASHNQAQFQFTGDISIGGKDDSAQRIFEAKLSGEGELRPFDPVRSRWEPNWKSSITLAKGSKLDTVPLLGKMEKALSKVSQLGIDLSGLLINGELAQDATTEVSHKRGRYQFEQPLLLDFGDTTLNLHKGNWINAATNQHEIKSAVTASEQFTKEVQRKAEAYVSKQFGGQLSGDLVKTLFIPILKDGRINLELVSSGDLSNPRADIVTPIGTIGNIGGMLKQSGSAGGDLLKIGKGLLDGFFKKKK